MINIVQYQIQNLIIQYQNLVSINTKSIQTMLYHHHQKDFLSPKNHTENKDKKSMSFYNYNLSSNYLSFISPKGVKSKNLNHTDHSQNQRKKKNNLYDQNNYKQYDKLLSNKKIIQQYSNCKDTNNDFTNLSDANERKSKQLIIDNRITQLQKQFQKQKFMFKNKLPKNDTSPLIQDIKGLQYRNQKSTIFKEKRYGNPQIIFSGIQIKGLSDKYRNNKTQGQGKISSQRHILEKGNTFQQQKKIVSTSTTFDKKYPLFIIQKRNFQNQQNYSKRFNDSQIEYKKYLKSRLKWKKNDFLFVSKLGSGTQGQFFLAVQNKSGFVCGIKKVLKTRVENQKQRSQFINQVKLQFFTDNPNITKLYGIFDDKQAIYLIIQLMSDGNLFHKLEKKSRIQNQAEIANIVWQVCKGISYLHSKGIMHRDIKPQNILLHQGVVKIGDFGSAIGGDSLRKSIAGCLAYMSPQQIFNNAYDKAIDMWCIGILTFQLFFGKVPFQKQIIKIVRQNKKVQFRKIDFDEQVLSINQQIEQEKFMYGTNKRNMILTNQARQFIQGLLQFNSMDRLTVKQALKHSFLRKCKMDEQDLKLQSKNEE